MRFLAVDVGTGPRRRLRAGSKLPIYEAAPHGDLMLAGCFGLLRALAEKMPQYRAAIEPSLGPRPEWNGHRAVTRRMEG